MQRTRALVVKAWEKGTTLEVTPMVRLLFTYSNVGRETFRRLTGIEARLFMRGDGSVAIRFGKLAFGPLTDKYLRESAVGVGIGAALESEPGHEAVMEAKEQADALGQHANSWAQNLSIWWLMNSGGMLASSGGVPKR